MKSYFFYFTFLLALLFFACKKEQKASEFGGVLPHNEALPNRMLSDKERLALANASGLEVLPISIDSLQQRINLPKTQHALYYFWSANSNNLLHSQSINAINAHFPDSIFEITIVNIDDFADKAALTTLVRDNGWAGKNYFLEKKVGNWQSQIEETWNGQTPMLLIVPKQSEAEQEIFMYQNFSSPEKLLAYLEPFLLVH